MKRARMKDESDKAESKEEIKLSMEIAPFSFDHRFQIWTFGDSITQEGNVPGGWVNLLASAYTRKADVFNRGFSGYNTNHAVIMLDKQIYKWFQPISAPRIVTMCFGTNDASLLGSTGQHVSLDQFETNVKRLVHTLQHFVSDHENPDIDTNTSHATDKGGSGTTHISSSSFAATSSMSTSMESISVILITPPPIDEDAWLQHLIKTHGPSHKHTNRINKQTGKYAEVVAKVARLYSLPCIDIYNGMQGQSDWKSMMSDGLHLNAQGNQYLYESVIDCLQTHFPELTPSVLPLEGPHWSAIDILDPAISFVTAVGNKLVQGVMAIEEILS